MTFCGLRWHWAQPTFEWAPVNGNRVRAAWSKSHNFQPFGVWHVAQALDMAPLWMSSLAWQVSQSDEASLKCCVMWHWPQVAATCKPRSG